MLPTLAYMTCTEPGSQAKCRWLQTLFNGWFLLGGISLQAIPGARRSICYGQFLLFHLPKHGDTITCRINLNDTLSISCRDVSLPALQSGGLEAGLVQTSQLVPRLYGVVCATFEQAHTRKTFVLLTIAADCHRQYLDVANRRMLR